MGSMTHYETIVLNGQEYYTSFDVEERIVRIGNYSSAALDPEEYHGISEYRLEGVNWVEDIEGNIVDTTDEMLDAILEFVEEMN